MRTGLGLLVGTTEENQEQNKLKSPISRHTFQNENSPFVADLHIVDARQMNEY
jgi:hypothetical protein